MEGLQNYLDPDEEVLVVMTTGFGPAVRHLLIATVPLAFGVVVAGLFATGVHERNGGEVLFPLGIAAALGLLAFLAAAVSEALNASSCCVVSSRRVVVQRKGDIREAPLSDITGVDIQQWSGGGSVLLRQRNGRTLEVYWVREPLALRRKVLEAQTAL